VRARGSGREQPHDAQKCFDFHSILLMLVTPSLAHAA
jgi:hypothetical protein